MSARFLPRGLFLSTRPASVLAFCFASSAAAALACSIAVPALEAPMPWSEAEIPMDGVIYLDADRTVLIEGLIDPDGEPVEWDIRDSEFSDDVQQATPVGGWVVGDYLHGESESDFPVYTVVDEIDDEAPAFDITGWSGTSEKYVLSFCGGGPQESGVYLTLSDPGEPVVYVYETLPQNGDDGALGALFGQTTFVPARQGARFDVQVEAFDLSGNSSVRTTEAVMACDGCSGSIVSDGGSSAALLILAALGLRRRRTQSAL
jgi:MYXO-CTERM domain-containing protein